MTSDHFPPEDGSLSGDPDTTPELCPECERHITHPYSHRRDCEHWGDTSSILRPDRDD
jgi:hypothetical protein